MRLDQHLDSVQSPRPDLCDEVCLMVVPKRRHPVDHPCRRRWRCGEKSACMVEDRAEAVFPGLVPPCREQRVIIVDKAARVTQVEPIPNELKTILLHPTTKS